MQRKVQLYIEGYRIELFNDEQIQVTSSIQNVNDLSKTYTDFSQNFTVPASDYNNAFFEHWYNSEVNFTTDNNLRKDAYLEIDLTTFRKGKVQLDGATIVNGSPDSYKLTFYGVGVTLKDTFGEDLLSDLDYSDYAHAYTSAEVIARIEDPLNTYDVKYPLITSNRIWQYQSIPISTPFPNWLTDSLTNNNINTTSGAINKNELFPALRVSKILGLIEDKYGITFNGTFLDDDRFTKLFLWYKGKEQFQASSIYYDLSVNTVTPTYTDYNLEPFVNAATNEVTLQYQNGVIFHYINYYVTSTTTSQIYYVDIYQNGNLISTIQGSGSQNIPIAQVLNATGLSDVYNIKIRTAGTNVIASDLVYSVGYFSGATYSYDEVTVNYNNLSLSLLVDLAANAPQMKIADFIKGIMLMFNMTIYSVKDNEYWLEPIDDWYSKGAVVDISEYVDITTIQHDRMPLYKKISFKFQESECVLNKYYAKTYNKNYGDTSYQYNYDGGEFTIELPFENLLQNKFTDTSLQVGYSLNGEYAPYVPKPVLLYQWDNQAIDVKFHNDGGGHSTIDMYTPFGQDLYYNFDNYTLNFAAENSTLLNFPIQNTMFAGYYFSYLYNLYNNKQRLVSVKAKLPVSLTTGLELNDRLVIRDKRYIINEMKTNLNTGDVDLQLILDFRPVINSTISLPKVSTEGGILKYAVNLPNKAIRADLSCSDAGVTFDVNPVFESRSVKITFPAGANNTVYTIVIVYTYSNGTTTTETFNVLQVDPIT